MNITLKNIASRLKATIVGNKNASFSSLVTDSRNATNFSDALFVALKTPRNDGHQFIPHLYEKGVRSFLVSDKNISPKEFSGAGFLVVKNTVEALQKLASYKRSAFKNPVIAITGSNGKTIVKEWLYQLLQQDFAICRSPKSYNSQIGVPLSVWLLNENHTLGIFEAGISYPGEMAKLKEIILPDIGIITNIKSPHDENFRSRKDKANEKLKLFKTCKKILFCYDHQEINYCLKDKKFSKAKKISWGNSRNATLHVVETKKRRHETEILATYKKKKVAIIIPFTDEASIENAMHCWLYMLDAGYDNKPIAKRIKELSPVAMRLEMKEGVNNCSLVNDSYNSDLESLSIALDFLNRQHQHPKKTVILSDIFQTGKKGDELYREVASLFKTKKIHRLVGVGEGLLEHQELFDLEKEFFKTTADFLKSFSAAHFNNEAILVKGARHFGFERISDLLQQKSHDTVLEINLNNVVHNINYYKSLLKPNVRLMGMVKAFSYGSGSYEIANVLQHHNINFLAVAYADEGVALRKGGITVPIMVMNPEPQSFHDLVQYKLEPEIFSLRILDLYSEFIRNNYRTKETFYDIHIKIDTGMHRLGFDEDQIDLLIEKLKSCRFLSVSSVFSHLAGSDEEGLIDFTNEQIRKFGTLSTKISEAFSYAIMIRHLSNSAAIKRFPQAQFDMVRLGIGMYGIGASADEQKNLQNVGTWRTTISQIKKLLPGQTVGYSRKGIVNKPTTIATVPVGYADGYSRQLGNGKGCMYIGGKKCAVIGNVCMDMTMLDITGIDTYEGDDVIIFNSPETIAELARQSETIPYEILTSISPRVKRIYLEE